MEDISAREIARTGLAAAGVVLLAAVAFYGVDIATGSQLFFTHDIDSSDIWHLNYPMKHFYAEELRAWRLPLWSTNLGTGFPLHAEGQVAALYPLNPLLYRFLPLPLAFNWGILLHVVLAGAFCAMYARQMGAGRGGCVLAAVVFAFSGFFVTHLKHINMTATAVWIPLLLLLLERYARTRWLPTLAGFALVVGSMIFAGHPQIAYNHLLVAGLYALWLLIRIWRRDPSDGGGWTNALLFGGGLGYAVAIGLLLALPQILPTLELNSVGPRARGLTVAKATQYRYQPKHLLTFLVPDAFGDPGELHFETARDPATGSVVDEVRSPLFGFAIERPTGGPPPVWVHGYQNESDPVAPSLFWEITGYVGLLPLILAGGCVALGSRRTGPRVLVVFLVLSVLMALGVYGGLFYFFYYLCPGFSLFRFHGRFLLYADLALAVMAGIGWTLLVARLPETRRKLTGFALTAAVVSVCFADLWLALGDHNPKIDRARWTTPPVTVVRMKEDAGGELFRYARVDPLRQVFQWAYHRASGWKGDLSPYDDARDAIDDNLNLLYDLDNLNLHFQLRPRWMFELLRVFSPRTESGWDITPTAADIFGVRYLIDHEDALVDRYPELAQFPGGHRMQYVRPPSGFPRATMVMDTGPYTLRLHENPTVLPRAFLVPRARLVSEVRPPRTARGRPPSEVHSAILNASFDPREEVLIVLERDENPALFVAGAPGRPIQQPVEFVAYEEQRVHLRVEAPRDCWLFLSDTFYPGWTATVDGARTRIYRANLAGRALRLSPGKHDIEFHYWPTSFNLHLALAGLGMLLLATLSLQKRMLTGLLAR